MSVFIWLRIDAAVVSCQLAIVFSATITVTDGGRQSPESMPTASQRLPQRVRVGVLQSGWVGRVGVDVDVRAQRKCTRAHLAGGLEASHVSG